MDDRPTPLDGLPKLMLVSQDLADSQTKLTFLVRLRQHLDFRHAEGVAVPPAEIEVRMTPALRV